MLGEWDQDIFIFFVLALVASNCFNFFNSNELESGGQPFVNQVGGVRDQLASVRATSTQFKHLTNFSFDKFEDFCLDVCLIIASHDQTTCKYRGAQPY